MLTQEFQSYRMSDTIASELHNNIVLVDKIVERRVLKARPQFYILGGAALVLYNLNYNATLDIDTANKIESSIREEVSFFIDDAASEVTSLAFNYTHRATPYCQEELLSIEVYLLSHEDLFLTKLYSGRRKDFIAIVKSGILQQTNINLAKKILMTEYDVASKQRIIFNAKSIGLNWTV